MWLVAIITLGIYSFLYSDNKVYRIILNTMVGLSVGYSFIIAWKLTIGPLWWDKAWKEFQPAHHSGIGRWLGQFFVYIAHHPGPMILFFFFGFLGILWYFQLSRKYMWL
jgi:hypothetical protein